MKVLPGPDSLRVRLGKLIENNPDASLQHPGEVPISLLTPWAPSILLTCIHPLFSPRAPTAWLLATLRALEVASVPQPAP